MGKIAGCMTGDIKNTSIRK